MQQQKLARGMPREVSMQLGPPAWRRMKGSTLPAQEQEQEHPSATTANHRQLVVRELLVVLQLLGVDRRSRVLGRRGGL